MIYWRLSLWPTSGWLLTWVGNTVSTTSTPCFMYTLVATRHLYFLLKVRSQPGGPCRITMMRQKRWHIWQNIRSSHCMSTLSHFRNLNDWLSSCMIKEVLSHPTESVSARLRLDKGIRVWLTIPEVCRACNWSNVVAKETVPHANVAMQIWTVRHFASATVRNSLLTVSDCILYFT